MTSKNSFLVNMKENLKRRNWIAALYSVILLLAFPVGITLWITSCSYQKETEGIAVWRERMNAGLTSYLSINLPVALLVCVMAVICAVQGFSYLFRRQKMDMYMSVPVSKKRRFAVIYLNGILLFAVPYMVSLLISLCIGAGNGILSGTVVKCMLYSYLVYLVYYVAVYNITLAAVMLTGNLLVALCATVVFLFYEVAVKGIFYGMCAMFFYTFYSVDDTLSFFSPIIWIFENALSCMNMAEDTAMKLPELIAASGMTTLKILAVGAVFGVLAYFLYAVRPAEGCHKALAFRKTKPVIKVCLMVPITLLVGVLFRVIANSNTAMTIFGLVIGILLSHSILEVIFEADLRAAVKYVKSGLAGAVLVFAIFAVFQFDLTGYDKWVPKPEKVESAALAFSNVFTSGNYYDVENVKWMSATSYAFEKMELTDTEAVCTLMEEAVEDMKVIQNGENADDRILHIYVKYRMKNGTEKYRSVNLLYTEHKEEIQALTKKEEYKKGVYQVLDNTFNQKMGLASVNFYDGISGEHIADTDKKAVYEAFCEDLMQCGIETIEEEKPLGFIVLEYENPSVANYMKDFTKQLPVYASFERTMAYVKEHDISLDWKERKDQITRIEISKWNQETQETEEITFTDKAEIEALLPALTPGEVRGYMVFDTGDSEGYDAYVCLDYVNEEGEREGYGGYFCVNAALLPDFAKLGN